MKKPHIIILRAKNDITTVNRIVTMLRARRFAVETFNVNHTEDPEVMQVTFLVDPDTDITHKLVTRLDTLIDVYEVKEVSHSRSIEVYDELIVKTTDSAVAKHIEEHRKEWKSLDSSKFADDHETVFRFSGSYLDISEAYEHLQKQSGLTLLRSGVMAL